jgi:hypothetical protein
VHQLFINFRTAYDLARREVLYNIIVEFFDNKVIRRIFGPKRDELKGEWRKLHSGELNDLSCTPNIVRVIILLRRMRWVGHVALCGRGWVHPSFFMGKPEGDNPLGRHRRM